VKTVITTKAPTARTMTRTPFATTAPVAPPVPIPASTEPRNQAHAQVASTSVLADALTLPAVEAWQSHSPAGW
jgi:hypothetical protein